MRTDLTAVTLPKTLRHIGGSAFEGCSALTSITLNDGLETIEYRAFASCTALREVAFPDSVTTVGGAVLSGCTALNSVHLPNALTVLPMQALDYGAGFLLAFGTQAALLRQAREGGSWRVRITLAGVARWLRSLGRVEVQAEEWSEARPDISPYLETLDSGFGQLQAVRHCAQFSHTPVAWDHASVPPGTNEARW